DRHSAGGEHSLAEIGGGEEQERGHGEAGLGLPLVNAKSTNLIVGGVATGAQQGQVSAMPFRLHRALISVSGPDAVGFLDNILTQDLTKLAEAGVLYAALLSPQGKVLCDMFVWPNEVGVILETDPSRGGDLMRRLSLYKLRAKVTIDDVTDQFYALYAPTAFGGDTPDPRFPDYALGWREICPSDVPVCLPESDGEYEAQRIALGVPDLGRDARPDEVFALEALLEELNGVTFQKGCFVGQENVSRMKRRATTRRKFCPIVFEGAPPAFGTPVMAGAAELGTVRSGVSGRAVALLRLDRAVSAAAPLTADGRPVRLDPPPWLILPQREQG
ncbi:MAG: YgfZ/GcvT domain-containing protein, partial [Vitreimonas sp.]